MIVERLVEIAEKCVKEMIKLGASQAQVNAFLIDSALTRFANRRYARMLHPRMEE